MVATGDAPRAKRVRDSGDQPVHVPAPIEPETKEAARTIANDLLNRWKQSFSSRPAAEVAEKSIAPSTQRDYKFYFCRFVEFILRHSKTFDSCTADDVFDFLIEYAKSAPKYASVCTARTAIRWYLKAGNKPEILADARWSTFMKGMKRSTLPSEPRFHVWNPERVLSRISKAAKPVALIQSGQEAVTLLMLATGLRVDDIFKLRAKSEQTDFGIRLFFREPRKTDCVKQFVTYIDVASFPGNRGICPVRSLLRYLRLAREARTTEGDSLVISTTGAPAAKQTIQRWVRTELARAGIIATAGSARSAAASAAFASGLSVDVIMRSAGWISENVFRKHYLRPVFTPSNLYSRYAPLAC